MGDTSLDRFMGEDYRRIGALGVGGWRGCDHSFFWGWQAGWLSVLNRPSEGIWVRKQA